MPQKTGVYYDKEHFRRIEAYVLKIQRMYTTAASKAVGMINGINFDSSKPFSYDDYPKIKQEVDGMIQEMNQKMYVQVNEMSRKEWLAACYKNDELVDYFASKINIPTSILKTYKSRNLEALTVFQDRKLKGLNLSDRIWRYNNQFKGDLELALDIGLGEGRSAAKLSRDVRSYLNNPDTLFRRVKDKYGNLKLSKHAQQYHPGPGAYRSAYKNAMRLTRTETNMAYRKADYEKNQQLDFIVGFEVKRSNHFFCCKLCEVLVGKYPKSFVFTGWHPHCRCFCVPITATQQEFIEHEKRILAGKDSILESKNEIKEIPGNFKDWITQNKDKIEAAESKPYFLTENQKLIEAAK